MLSVGINGFGRIGRCVFKILEQNDINILAINDLGNPEVLAHLLQYDSIHGKYDKKVFIENDYLVVNHKKIKILNFANPELLPWEEFGIDIVIEATGAFLTKEKAAKHIQAGAKKVITTAPVNDSNVPTIVYGINDNTLNGAEKIISNASCTTNCLGPMVKVLDDNFGILKGFINTIHAYTADQRLQDAPHKDFRRARSAAVSIIPTTTGAAKAIGKVIPHLRGKLDGIAMRVPVINGSVIDFTVELGSSASAQEVNEAFEIASKTYLKDILRYNTDPIVSCDINGSRYSCIFDAPLTYTIGNLVKIIGWYDNETGYSNRIVDLIKKLSRI